MLHCKNIFKKISKITYFFLEVLKMRVNIGLSKGKRKKYENNSKRIGDYQGNKRYDCTISQETYIERRIIIYK